MSDEEQTRAAAAVLVDLLSTREEYRRRWQRHMRRAARAEVHQAAVVAVLAHHQWDAGVVDEADDGLPRRLKHTVSRALSGATLAPATVRLFIDAFAMSQLDATRLWTARTGGDPLRTAVVRDEFALRRTELPVAPRFQTVSLHDFHVLDDGGLPRSHRTVHIVRALEEFDRYPYRFDTDAATVEVLRGGTASPLSAYEDGTYGVDIRFARPVSRGETASFEYRTIFDYAAPPPPEFRRAVRRRSDNLEIHVQFHPRRLPRRLWWGTWDQHTDAEPATVEPVALDPDHSVHRFLDTVVETCVGFRWEFGTPGVGSTSWRSAPSARA